MSSSGYVTLILGTLGIELTNRSDTIKVRMQLSRRARAPGVSLLRQSLIRNCLRFSIRSDQRENHG